MRSVGRSVVIVPTYQRSDLLYVCLERIKESCQHPIHVFPDRGTDETEVCAIWNARHHTTVQHSYHGNSYNVLEALKWAYQSNFEMVYVVEDDAILDATFFSWADAALLKHPDAFAACGWQYSPDAILGDGPDLMIPWYLSVCAALPRQSLYQLVQHAKPEYYGEMRGYLDRTFPTSHRRGTQHFEQDGLSLRVAEAAGQRCVWPRRPRATHCGWHGYHMSGKPLEGSLLDRVAVVKLALKTPSVLRSLMAGGLAPDISRCQTCETPLLADRGVVADLVCVPCFHREHPTVAVSSGSHYYLRR